MPRSKFSTSRKRRKEIFKGFTAADFRPFLTCNASIVPASPLDQSENVVTDHTVFVFSGRFDRYFGQIAALCEKGTAIAVVEVCLHEVNRINKSGGLGLVENLW